MSELRLWLQSFLYRKLLGTVLPVSRFTPHLPESLPAPSDRNAKTHIEIVSHCWQYGHLLSYQLSSLIRYAPKNLQVTYTLFYCREDEKTHALAKHCQSLDIPGLTWQFKDLPKDNLFRRAIGRNQAALATQADWVWFTDCDIIFHEGCLENLAAELQGKNGRMYFPSHEKITNLLETSDVLFDSPESGLENLDIDTDSFEHNEIRRAKGAFQIVHGDVCRTAGYCKMIPLYHKPSDRWFKTYEDSVFRQLIESEGEALNFSGLYRIRHIEKGRYKKEATSSGARMFLRKHFDHK